MLSVNNEVPFYIFFLINIIVKLDKLASNYTLYLFLHYNLYNKNNNKIHTNIDVHSRTSYTYTKDHIPVKVKNNIY